MSSVFVFLPRLHALLALLIVQAQNPQLSYTKLLRLTRTIVRLTRLIIKEETAAAHHALKTAMLSDPKWRARVIWQLGGLDALLSWRQRFLFKCKAEVGAKPRIDGSLSFQSSAPENGAENRDISPFKPEPKPQYRFRLKQPERAFYGRRPAETDIYKPYEPKPAISRLAMPIPLMPYDFWPRLETKSATKSAVPNSRHYGAEFHDEAKPDKSKSPPPKFEPP